MKRPTQRSIPAKLASSLVLITLLTAPWAAAQRSAHASASHQHFNQRTGNFASRQNAHRFHRSSNTSPPFQYSDGFFTPDDFYSSGYPVASQPPIFLLQAPRSPADSSDYPSEAKQDRATPAQPLMIELQHGRYVRINSTAANGEVLPQEQSQSQTTDTKPTSTTLSSPPALLVFRDGHTEEVRDYAIADGTLYARGDYYTDGYWNKKINLATLNVAKTLQANHERNVKFVLPSSPNQVITRP